MRTSPRFLHPVVWLLILAVAVFVFIGRINAQSAQPTEPATIQTSNQEGLGDFLVDGNGMSLYLFTSDEQGAGASTCSGDCAAAWPPLLTAGDATTGGEMASADLLGALQREDGSTQVTYNGWPLYYYVEDQQPGDTTGQGVGDVWYLVTPAGEPIEAAVEGAGAEEAAAEEGTEEEAAAAEEAAAPPQQAPPQMALGSAVQPTGTLPGEPTIQLVQVASGLVDPVNVAAAPDGSGRLFIVERVGRVRIVQDGELLEEPFLDISEVVKTDFLEQGLLGLAFHPDYAENGRFFVYYIDYRTNGDSVLAEFSVSADDPNFADPQSARVLLTHDQPFVNHNGGTVKFGPDGYLYWAMGDGGMAGDPYRNAQDLSNLLGKILRIDVDTDNGQGYGIPEDNPFQGRVIYSPEANNLAQDGSYIPDARPEIFVYGLRNPWEFSFDPQNGDLFIADVGQNAWEEINYLPADSEPGANFGWPILEGSNCYPPGAECAAFGALPVAEYENTSAVGCSITGIGSYRGEEFPALDGIYFVSDFCTGIVWGLAQGEDGAWQFAELLDTSLLVTGAGEDEAGDLYVAACNCQFGRNYDPYENPGGTVWRIVAGDQVPEGAETAPTE